MEQAQTTQVEQQAQAQQLQQQQSQGQQQVQQGQQGQAQQKTPDANANAQVQAQALEQQRQQMEQQHSAAIAAKDQEIANLRAELEVLKKAPGASTSQVVEAEKKDKPEEHPSAVEAFFESRQRAAALYDMLP